MKQLIVLACAAICTVSVVAKDRPFSSNKPLSEMTPEERAIRHKEAAQNRLEYYGGKVSKPGSQKGRILFVDACAESKDAAVASVIESETKMFKFKVECVKNAGEKPSPKNAAKKMKELGADVAIFLVECDECETPLLVAPDSGWAIVNFAPILKDAKNDAFKANRTRKTLTRAFYATCGAMNGNQSGSLMGTVTKAEDIDRLGDAVPLEVVQRIKESLEKRGVTPEFITTYRRACKLGWAPMPTNAVEKAIWDEMHELPSAPIKIKYDPKRDGK